MEEILGRKCRLSDVPIGPADYVGEAWSFSCSCGYGGLADSPEAAVLTLAQHVEDGRDLVLERLRQDRDRLYAACQSALLNDSAWWVECEEALKASKIPGQDA